MSMNKWKQIYRENINIFKKQNMVNDIDTSLIIWFELFIVTLKYRSIGHKHTEAWVATHGRTDSEQDIFSVLCPYHNTKFEIT